MANNLAFAYMVRNYAESRRQETPEQTRARMERQEQADKRYTDAMEALASPHLRYDKDGDLEF